MSNLFNIVKGDKIIWIVVIFLSLFSLLAVYSSTGTLAYKYQSGNTEYYLIKHVSLMLFGLILMYLSHRVNYKFYSSLSLFLLLLTILLLVITLFKGTEINEARRWLSLPIINYTFQTSDLAKITLLIYLARGLSRMQQEKQDLKKTFLPLIAPVIVVCGLIAPADFSTATMLFGTCMLLMFIGRVSAKYLLLLFVSGGLIMSAYVGISMKFSENSRVKTWENRLNNYMYGETESYQIQQAKIAIATGGIFGKGPGKSTQRNYLPHPYSDFIYAIIIEEYGIIGGLIILFLYMLFLFRCMKIVVKSPKAFGALLAVGLSFSVVIQALINMAVAVNLVPVTGLTLPLVSMGGTSLWFSSLSIGIILSVSKHIEADNDKTKVEGT